MGRERGRRMRVHREGRIRHASAVVLNTRQRLKGLGMRLAARTALLALLGPLTHGVLESRL